MFRIIDGNWLVRYDKVTETLSLSNLDPPIDHVYSATAMLSEVEPIFPEPESNSSIQLLTSVSIHPDEDETEITVIKKLENGSELKPRRIQSKRDPDSSPKTQIGKLVGNYEKQSMHSQQKSAELEKTEQILHQVVEEKVKYQDVVSKRVYAMLEERNVWLEKLRGMKPEDPGT